MSESGLETESAELRGPHRFPEQRIPPARPSRTTSWVSLANPGGWLAKESITLLAPDGSANVIASTEPVDPDLTVGEYVARQGDLLTSEFDDYVEFVLEPVVIEGVEEAVLREFAWTPPDGERVRQVQVYAVRDGRGITATATTASSLWEDRRDALRAAIFSLVVDPS